jgi:hypothetical protein
MERLPVSPLHTTHQHRERKTTAVAAKRHVDDAFINA